MTVSKRIHQTILKHQPISYEDLLDKLQLSHSVVDSLLVDLQKDNLVAELWPDKDAKEGNDVWVAQEADFRFNLKLIMDQCIEKEIAIDADDPEYVKLVTSILKKEMKKYYVEKWQSHPQAEQIFPF